MDYQEEVTRAAAKCIDAFGLYGKEKADSVQLQEATRIATAFNRECATVLAAIDDRIDEII